MRYQPRVSPVASSTATQVSDGSDSQPRVSQWPNTGSDSGGECGSSTACAASHTSWQPRTLS
jgi:hypothetical protein